MTRPTERSENLAPIAAWVEASPGSGTFERDDRLRVDQIETVIDGRLSEAEISVRLGHDFDLVDARTRYHGDLRIVIAMQDAHAADRNILLDGYPLVQSSRRRGGPRQPDNAYELVVTSVYGRWAQDGRSQVFGRRMRSGEILDGLQSSSEFFGDQSVLAAALPCVFNLDGLPNRSAVPLDVTDVRGGRHRIFAFTHDGDPAGEMWSLLDALRYLVWFYHTPEGPVEIESFMALTAMGVGVDPNNRGGFIPSNAVVDRLIALADDLNCEATNLVEAINLLVDAAGISSGVESRDVNGAVTTTFRLWAAGDSPRKSLKLAWGGRYADGTARYDTSKLLAGDVTRDNQLRDIDVQWLHDDVVTSPLVVGGVKRWEMTVPLVPGWLPELDLDNVAVVDRADAKALAVTPDIVEFLGDLVEDIPWFRKYHKRGADFDQHRDVARLWVLNEDGAFDGASYNRNAPFDNYQPFDFSTVADREVTAPGAWTRRLRPLMTTITRDDRGDGLGVFVEVSYDSGATWHRPVGAVKIDKVRGAIRFDLSNPTAMVEEGGDFLINNMWFALIDQVFRVRATAVIESDERLSVSAAANPAATPTIRQNALLLYQPNNFAFASRNNTTNALTSIFAGPQSGEVNQTHEAALAARRIADEKQSGVVKAVARIPWLDEQIALGDRIEGIDGRDVSLDGLARGASVSSLQWHVVGKIYQIAERDIRTTLELARAAV